MQSWYYFGINKRLILTMTQLTILALDSIKLISNVISITSVTSLFKVPYLGMDECYPD